MLKKKSKYFIFLFIFILSIFYNIDTVNAGTYDCDNEKYQCIACKYTIDPNNPINDTLSSPILKNNDIIFYVKADGKGSATVVTDGDSNIEFDKDEPIDVNQYISIQNLGTGKSIEKLVCPNMYYRLKQTSVKDGVARKVKYSYVLSYTKKKDIELPSPNDVYARNEKVTGTKTKDNKKDFKAKSSSSSSDNSNGSSSTTTKQCKTEIRYESIYSGEGEQSALSVDSEKATVTSGKDSVSITSLPDKYLLASDSVASYITTDDYKDGCPSDIIVLCVKKTDVAAEKPECSLVKQSRLDTKYVDKDTGRSLKTISLGDTPIIDIHSGPTELTCDDVSQLHTIWVIIWILSPILVIVFGSMDIFKAVIAGDVKKLEESRGKIPKRIISALVVAFIPTIISVAVGFSTNDDVKDTSLMYCIINGEGSSNNNNNEDKNNSSSGKKSNTTSSNTYLNSACESACSYAKYGNTSLYDSCKSKCIKGYNNSCSSIPTSETVARDSCYKNYAKKYKSSN